MDFVTTEYAIDLTKDSGMVENFSYRTGPDDRDVVTEHVTKMMKHGILELAIIPCASLVELPLKRTDVTDFCRLPSTKFDHHSLCLSVVSYGRVC